MISEHNQGNFKIKTETFTSLRFRNLCKLEVEFSFCEQCSVACSYFSYSIFGEIRLCWLTVILHVADTLGTDFKVFGSVTAYIAHPFGGDDGLTGYQLIRFHVAHTFGVDLHLVGLAAHDGVAHSLGADLHMFTLQVVC